MADQETELPPHILIFPYPAQGHVNSMLKLAELLCHAGIHVTFLVADDIHRRLLRCSTAQSQPTRYPGFRFETIPDGLAEDDPRDNMWEMFRAFRATAKPLLQELLRSDPEKDSKSGRKRVSCVIADGIMNFALDVGEEIGIPIIVFRTTSACNFWAYFCGPKLSEAGDIPFQGDNLDEPIKGISGADGFLRRRDLPSFFRCGDNKDHDICQLIVRETLDTTRARALIFNTFEELEGPILAQARSQCPQIYAIGPLHEHLKVKVHSPTPSNSLWEEDMSCMTWLDTQSPKSVIYISFGSTTTMTKGQLMEFWHGLVNSGKPFLWVIRPNSVMGEDWKNHLPTKIAEATTTRGFIVEWAPQDEVLGHKSVGGFLTHSGWNSTVESIVVGVPMICWPYFGDQHINSRFVGEVWKLGIDMKDTCNRVMIEDMIQDLMDVRKEEFQQSCNRMARLAKEAIAEGGSSYCDFDRLIRDIRLMADGCS